ncbi:MAG: TldD/PmbA family protein [Anaerolineae bacterium]
MDRERIVAAIRGSRADYTEIRIESTRSTQVIFRGNSLETVDLTSDQGGIVRCLVRGGGWGISTFNNLAQLQQRVDEAYQNARLVQADPISLASVPFSQSEFKATLGTDFRIIPLIQKKELAECYNAILLSYRGVIDTHTTYADEFTTVTYANSEGAFLVEERPMVTMWLEATAREGENVQQAYDGLSLPAGFEQVIGLEALAHKVGQRAVALIKAKTVVGGQYPVICDPLLAGIFIHEAFGHLSEADFVYANPSAQQMMVLGRRFGPENLNVIDDGSLPGRRGTHFYDDEGTPTQRTELIKQGILVGRLHSRETASRMREAPTGNARSTGYRFPPIVRMTNTYIDQGVTSFNDMISDIKLGVYACDAFGGETMLENFSFSAGYGYMIRNGRVAELVKDVVLGGNLFTTLQDITAIGNDLTFSRGGSCGKGQGQGLPVSTGAPHVRIENVAVGGRSVEDA